MSKGGGGACECPRVGVFFKFSEGGWRHADDPILAGKWNQKTDRPIWKRYKCVSITKSGNGIGWLESDGWNRISESCTWKRGLRQVYNPLRFLNPCCHTMLYRPTTIKSTINHSHPDYWGRRPPPPPRPPPLFWVLFQGFEAIFSPVHGSWDCSYDCLLKAQRVTRQSDGRIIIMSWPA